MFLPLLICPDCETLVNRDTFMKNRTGWCKHKQPEVVKLGSRPCPCQLQMTTFSPQTHSLSLLSRFGPRADSIYR